MVVKNIYNSSSKIIGTVEFYEDKLIIKNNKNPELVLDDPYVLEFALSRKLDEDFIFYLYNDLTLPTAEIAAILDQQYHRLNKFINTHKEKITTHLKEGRRNSSYGQKFSKLRVQHMREALSGGHIYNNSEKERNFKEWEDIPPGFVRGRLPYSEEHKQKIREAALSGKYLSPSQIARRGWEKGKFDNVNFKKGIAGYMTSIKSGERLFFRSLLELFYIIHFIEEDDSVSDFKYEPFRITCDNGSFYTPDFQINTIDIIELKSWKYVHKQGDKVLNKFLYKKEQAEKYCFANGLNYKVIFDIDIGFDTESFKHVLRESEYVNKYKIEFLQPERVWSKKSNRFGRGLCS